MDLVYGQWYLAILAGAKEAKSKDKKFNRPTQQLIIKTWRYGSQKELWESAQETKRVEELSGDKWLTDIRIETRKAVPETQGEFTRLYNLFRPSAKSYLDRHWATLHSGDLAKHVAFNDVMSLGRAASFILNFTNSANSPFNIEIFKKRCPDMEWWINAMDLQAMMKACIADLLVEMKTREENIGEVEEVAISA